MLVFLDFEASSLSDRSYPIEVGWVFEDGEGEAHLIRPAPAWTEWDPKAEAIHRVSQARLLEDGAEHGEVARRMIEVLSGHDLCASAPSWDGKWLSVLLRAAGLPRHALRLRSTDDVLRDTARTILAQTVSGDELEHWIESVLTLEEVEEKTPAHRALADARQERQRWLDMRERAEAAARAAR